MSDEPKAVHADVYLPVMKILIKKYGNFKVSQELHNYIIESLACICDAIEEVNGRKK